MKWNPLHRSAALALCGVMALAASVPAFAALPAKREAVLSAVTPSVGEASAITMSPLAAAATASDSISIPEALTPDVPVTLPAERENTGGKTANAPSDGGWRGVSEAKLLEYLKALAKLPHYQQDRAARYLNYYGSKKYTPEQILRIVNTDNDLQPYTDLRGADTDKGILMLVNKYNDLGHYVPSDLKPLGSYGSWGEMRQEARDAFVSLVDAARADGYRIWAVSPYRSRDRQNGIYNSYVYNHGRASADTYSARPGFSEHQTGLAVDVGVYGHSYNSFGSSREFSWMTQHAHEYGYILRYGKGMSYITGYMYEPWHYRYVGVEAATRIHEEGLTFEEYYAYYVAGESVEKTESAPPLSTLPDAIFYQFYANIPDTQS